MASTPLDAALEEGLESRRQMQLFRQRRRLDSPQQPHVIADGRALVSFCSNDYLGLANHPEVNRAFIAGIEKYGSGSGASHLVCGHTAAHEALEERLAAFTGRDRALLFSSGYMANVGVLTCLAGKHDRVLEDRLNHASLLDGGLFSGAAFRRYAHGDPESLRALLQGNEVKGRSYIVTDGVFSMDGDIAPLPELVVTAAEHDAVLMVDDAHGFGCLGADGGGTLAYWQEQGYSLGQDQCHILVGTLGKAFGTAGAFVAGSEALIETLVQFCRPYIYTTAQPAAVACATLKSLDILERDSGRRARLQELVSRFRAHCASLGFTLTDSCTPIQAILLGSESRALAASRLLENEGLLVTAIRPPTVPPGTSRLRVTLSAAHTDAQFSRLLKVLEILAESGSEGS